MYQAAAGVTVTIHDAGGDIVLTSNAAGNFFTAQGNPSAGYTATVDDGVNQPLTKITTQTNGGCNNSSCHAPGKQGRIFTQ